MEGGVFEDERINIDINNGIGNKRGRGEDEKQMGRLGKRPSGIVVMDEEYSYSGDEMINGVKYEEEKTPSTPTSASIATSGGLFNQLLTNLVNNNSPKSVDGGHGGEVGGSDHHEVVKKDDDDDDDDGVVEENGGGLDQDNKENVGGDGGESIIDDIVAKLPRTLSEDTVRAPEPDEASILLHSIIHD